jgi:hypothetical protein
MRVAVAITSVATRSDDRGGQWIFYVHHDGDAELWYRERPGMSARKVIGKQIFYKVVAAMEELGISPHQGWRRG